MSSEKTAALSHIIPNSNFRSFFKQIKYNFVFVFSVRNDFQKSHLQKCRRLTRARCALLRSEGAPSPHPARSQAAAPCAHVPDPAGAGVDRAQVSDGPPRILLQPSVTPRPAEAAAELRPLPSGVKDSRERAQGGRIAFRSHRRSAGSCAACQVHVPEKLFQTLPPPASVRACSLPPSLSLLLPSSSSPRVLI